MATQLEEQTSEATVVASVPAKNRATLQVGKPRKVKASAMQSKVAYCGTAGGGSGGGSGGGGATQGFGGNYYSPELSTDFLELPQSLDEQRNYYRFFYRTDPFVGQAIDVHTEIPLSKVRLSMPKARNREIAEKSLRFCEKWVKRVGLLQRMIEIVHEYYLIGEVFIFAEDTNPLMPREIIEAKHDKIDEETGEITEVWEELEDANERATEWLKKNYKGWTALRVLPPEQIHMESFPFTDEKLIELVPDSKSKSVIDKASQGDPTAQRIVDSMPPMIVDYIRQGQNIPLNTDPQKGSFLFYMSRKKSQYEPRGHSILERCILPGTPIWVNRGGIVQQAMIEDVDVTTDTLLTTEGRFRRAEKGSRHVDEEIVVLEIEGAKQPLRLTQDHRVLVINEDGTEKWVFAGDIQSGDTLREAHLLPIPKSSVAQIDVAGWWEDRTLRVGRRVRDNRGGYVIPHRDLLVMGVEKDDVSYTTTFRYPQDDAGRIEAVENTRKIVQWLKSIKQPTSASYKALAGLLGLTKGQVAAAICRLKETGCLRFEMGSDRTAIWHPINQDVTVPGEFEFRSFTSNVGSVQIDEDFCYLLGTWLGDGCAWVTDELFLNIHSLGWTFGKGDDVLRTRVCDLIEKVFGIAPVAGNLYGEEETAQNIRLEDDPLLTRWFVEEFGHGFDGKRLPDWVFHLPDVYILALLRGLLDTDGYLSVTDTRAVIDIQLGNPTLVDQVHLLCNRVGLHTSVSTTHRKPSSWTRTWQTKNGPVTKTYGHGDRVYSRITCSRQPDVLRWAEGSLKGQKLGAIPRKEPRDSKFKNGWLTRTVLDVLRIPYTGTVLSFDVEEDESLVAGGVGVHNCIRTLVYRDKLRQAQTSIASRHMTPFRIVYGEDLNDDDVAMLREQVDLALQDPDYSIIANFEVRWEEKGAERRLLELSSEYDLTDRQLYAGLGVTESLLSGESSYSGDRINLEVINIRYMLLRELLQDLFEQNILSPMCEIMGFVEEDEDGEEVVIHPRLSFTRLALRDNQDTFDALFNLYQKGSLDVDAILEILNIDPVATREKLENDRWTTQDSSFNELFRSVYSRVGDALAENSDVTDIVAQNIGLKYEKPDEGGGRF